MAAGDQDDVDLDSILGQLCELQDELTSSLQTSSEPAAAATPNKPPEKKVDKSAEDWDSSGIDSQLQDALSELSDFISGDSGLMFGAESSTKKADSSKDATRDGASSSISDGAKLDTIKTASVPVVPPTENLDKQTLASPGDRDSAISEAVSIPSSSSHISVNTVTSGIASIGSNETPASEEQRAKLKQEKLRLALEKLEETNLEKLLVCAYCADGSTKTLFVGENMTVLDVTQVLAAKNCVRLNTDWALVEILAELNMERLLEDHEFLVENMLFWTKDSTNKLMFVERPEKYQFYKQPELYLKADGSKSLQKVTEAQRTELLDKFFADISPVPKLEGVLHMKAEGKKSWKKYFFALRGSGLYYNPKSKGKPSQDLTRLLQFDVIDVYYGIGWKKKYKAPTDFGFALKHPQIQKKASKYIHYLCGEDEATVQHWVNAIRVVKHGKEQLNSYRTIKDISKHWDGSEHNVEVKKASKPAAEKMQNGGHTIKHVDVNANEPSVTPHQSPSKVSIVSTESSQHQSPSRGSLVSVESFRGPDGEIRRSASKHGYEEAESNFIVSNQRTGAYIPVTTGTLKHIAKQHSNVQDIGKPHSSAQDTSPKQQKKPPATSKKPNIARPVHDDLPPPPPDPRTATAFPPPPSPGTLRTSMAEEPDKAEQETGTYFAVVKDSQTPARPARQSSGTYFAVTGDSPDAPPTHPQHGGVHRPISKLPSPGLPPPPPPINPPPPPDDDLPPPPYVHYMPTTAAPSLPQRPPPKPTGYNPLMVPRMPLLPVGGARPKVRPPPLKRTEYSRVAIPAGDHNHFRNDLERVIQCKHTHSYNMRDKSYVQKPMWEMPDDLDYLPPPPPELLEGLPSRQQRAPPPPVPRRSENTRLSIHR